jgi:hypothetical protein
MQIRRKTFQILILKLTYCLALFAATTTPSVFLSFLFQSFVFCLSFFLFVLSVNFNVNFGAAIHHPLTVTFKQVSRLGVGTRFNIHG